MQNIKITITSEKPTNVIIKEKRRRKKKSAYEKLKNLIKNNDGG